MSHASRTMKRHAREMRKAPTRPEDRIWSWLRDRRFKGLKFRRQVPVGAYILDFYCACLNLAIELDGAQHNQPDMVDYDSRRSHELEKRGIYVLRIPNELLLRDCQMVAEMIRCAVDGLADGSTPHPPSAPSPLRGGEKGLERI